MGSRQQSISSVLFGVWLALAATFAGACADFSRGDPVPGGTGGRDGGSGAAGDAGQDAGGGGISFAATVHPLLMQSCASCHKAGGDADDTLLVLSGMVAADHTTVLAFVNTADPASSRLLSKASGRGHEGGAVFAAGSPDHQTVLDWIQAGALP